MTSPYERAIRRISIRWIDGYRSWVATATPLDDLYSTRRRLFGDLIV